MDIFFVSFFPSCHLLHFYFSVTSSLYYLLLLLLQLNVYSSVSRGCVRAIRENRRWQKCGGISKTKQRKKKINSDESVPFSFDFCVTFPSLFFSWTFSSFSRECSGLLFHRWKKKRLFYSYFRTGNNLNRFSFFLFLCKPEKERESTSTNTHKNAFFSAMKRWCKKKKKTILI